MRQEVPFKSVKVTLSEEAIRRLAELRFRSSLRSDSATIEECIRVVYDVTTDIALEINRCQKLGQEPIPMNIQAETLRRIGIRVARFMPQETIKPLMEKLKTK